MFFDFLVRVTQSVIPDKKCFQHVRFCLEGQSLRKPDKIKKCVWDLGYVLSGIHSSVRGSMVLKAICFGAEYKFVRTSLNKRYNDVVAPGREVEVVK
jgi:hypothetical protein